VIRSCPREPWGIRGGAGQGGATQFSPKRQVNDVGVEAAVRRRFKAAGEF
jgi:hypothetical protein